MMQSTVQGHNFTGLRMDLDVFTQACRVDLPLKVQVL
jgi:hypothetical protein